MAIQRVRDPLHNLIEFDTDDETEGALWRLVQTKPFQRLRRIKQLGFSDLVYPGASHSRLSHSLGVFHTSRQLMGVIRKNVGSREDSREPRALAAALLHDLGHGPFSHAFETVGKRLKIKLADHEHVSDRLIRSGEVSEILNEMGGGFADDVANIIKKEGRVTVHNAVVTSQFDADRLDYMRRDRLMTGTQHSAIDYDWLIANLRIAEVPYGVDEKQIGTAKTFVIGPKAIHAAEAYVLGLFQLYPTVYFHKATRGAEKLFVELMVKAVTLIKEDSISQTGLSDKHPLVRFARDPDNLDLALKLDDTVIWGSLPLLMESRDKLIQEFATRLRDRQLYKCFDIRTRVAHEINPDNDNNPERIDRVDRCCSNIYSKLKQWCDESTNEVPRLLIDQATRSPYRGRSGPKGPSEHINVMTDHGQLIDLKQRSSVVAALSDFKLLRAYYHKDDSGMRSIIERIVGEEIK